MFTETERIALLYFFDKDHGDVFMDFGWMYHQFSKN